MRAEIDQIDETLKTYEADIAKLQGKLREARARQNAIAARLESAVTRAKAREILHGRPDRRRLLASSTCLSAAPTLPKAAPTRSE